MMKVLLRVAMTIVVFAVGLMVVGLFLPADYMVERKIMIKAPPEQIYSEVVDLRQWPKWGVWFKRDPNMEIKYAGPDRAIGMSSHWNSESQGEGEMEITQLVHNQKVIYSLYFPDFDMGSTGAFELTATDSGTLVVWRDSGTVGLNPVDRYFALFMDAMIGPDFDAGLENLKVVVESRG